MVATSLFGMLLLVRLMVVFVAQGERELALMCCLLLSCAAQRSKKPLWMFGLAGQTRTSFTHVSFHLHSLCHSLRARTLNKGNEFCAAPPSKILPTPPLVARRLRTGVGQERGRLGVEVINHLEEEVEVVWVETWPWWVRTFVHTLEAVVADNLSTGEI